MKGAESSQIVAEVDREVDHADPHADDSAVRGPPSRGAGRAAPPGPEDTPVARKAKLSRIKKNRAAAAAARSSTQAQEKALARIKVGGENRQGDIRGGIQEESAKGDASAQASAPAQVHSWKDDLNMRMWEINHGSEKMSACCCPIFWCCRHPQPRSYSTFTETPRFSSCFKCTPSFSCFKCTSYPSLRAAERRMTPCFEWLRSKMPSPKVVIAVVAFFMAMFTFVPIGLFHDLGSMCNATGVQNASSNVRIRGGDAHADAPRHLEHPFGPLFVLLIFGEMFWGSPFAGLAFIFAMILPFLLLYVVCFLGRLIKNGCENPFGSDPNRTLSSYRGGTSLDCECQNQNNPAVGAGGGAALICLALAILLYFPFGGLITVIMVNRGPDFCSDTDLDACLYEEGCLPMRWAITQSMCVPLVWPALWAITSFKGSWEVRGDGPLTDKERYFIWFCGVSQTLTLFLGLNGLIRK